MKRVWIKKQCRSCFAAVVALLTVSLGTFSTRLAADEAKGTLELIDEFGVDWTIPAAAENVSVLVVGGGGGGAPGLGGSGGGGGAGGLVYVDDYLKTFHAEPGDKVDIRVGLPGGIVDIRQARSGLPGEESRFGEIVALGGGGGGRHKLEKHQATPGGSGGGGVGPDGKPAAALQPGKSGVGVGFGHAGGDGAGGSGGGGAGGRGTSQGKGGGGSGLQGVPKDAYVDSATGFATDAFDPANPDLHKVLFRDVFGSGYGDDGWFGGGGAHNSPHHRDEGGKGGGSKRAGMPHTGGGGGGSTHGFEGGKPSVGGSGVVLVCVRRRDGSISVRGWGRVQPIDFLLVRPNSLITRGEYADALKLLDAIKDVGQRSAAERQKILRAYGRIFAGQGCEKEAMATLKQANQLDGEINDESN